MSGRFKPDVGSLPLRFRLQLRIHGRHRLFQRIAPLLKSHLPHGGPVASPVDGVHHRQGATHPKRKSQEETDERAGRKVHPPSLPPHRQSGLPRARAKKIVLLFPILARGTDRNKTGKQKHGKKQKNDNEIRHTAFFRVSTGDANLGIS